MRKFYPFITGFFLSLVVMQAQAQNDVADFTYVSSGNTFQFTNTSTTVPNDTASRRCYWQFGDGSSVTTFFSVNPYHTYAQPGSYEVCLYLLRKVPNSSGTPNDSLVLFSTVCKKIVVAAPDSCSANFATVSTNATSLGKYFLALPWHNNKKSPIKICWSFGDNRDTCINYDPTVSTQNTTYPVYHLYNHTGNYNVCVNITYAGGCESHYCRTVSVGVPDSCSANFEMVATSPTALGKYFVAHPWNNNNKKPVYICWSFGDNRDTCIQYSTTYTGNYAVFHQYTHAGDYNVCVKIMYDGGCQSSFCKVISTGVADSCSANFETLAVSSTTLGRYFVAQPWNNHNKKPVQVCWNFGDNRDTCIQYSTTYSGSYAIYHLYTQPGVYNACVRILYDGGCESKFCKTIEIIGSADSCKADFERIPTTNANPLTIALQAITGNNHNKKPSRICWSFGDGSDTCINYSENYTGLYNIKHTYEKAGQFQVCVGILYFGGCEAKTCKPISIALPPDTCRVQVFEATPSINSLTRGFYAVPFSSNNRRVERVCWNFGDGNDTCITESSLNINPGYTIRHTYPGPGTYHVCATINFAGGCTAHQCIEIVIRSASDICGGYFIDSLIGPGTFKFRGQSIHNPNDNVVSYRWSFGDGSSATGQEVKHTFNPGTKFQVCLVINTEQGCETKICKPLLLPGANAPVLQLSPNPVLNNLHVVFISGFNETVSIRIVNSYGLIVRSYTKTVTTGPNIWDFDLSSLLTGVYSLSVQSPDQLASSIFLKQ
jgi:PKD repeat protein